MATIKLGVSGGTGRLYAGPTLVALGCGYLPPRASTHDRAGKLCCAYDTLDGRAMPWANSGRPSASEAVPRIVVQMGSRGPRVAAATLGSQSCERNYGSSGVRLSTYIRARSSLAKGSSRMS